MGVSERCVDFAHFYSFALRAGGRAPWPVGAFPYPAEVPYFLYSPVSFSNPSLVGYVVAPPSAVTVRTEAPAQAEDR